MNQRVPKVAVLTCTLNRPEHAALAASALLRSEYTDFELFILDQSKDSSLARRQQEAVQRAEQ